MRSSIACLRCRRSKIKCENQGAHAACETCIKSGQECKYPEVTAPAKRQPAVPTKRQEGPDAARQERDLGPERKRKKLEDISTWLEQRSNTYTDEVLSYPFLRGEIWEQIFTIFKAHFSTELPFLHFPTLQEKINEKQRDAVPDRDLNLVLLGILTLTARFHPDLPKYVAAIDPSLVGSSPGGTLRNRPGSSLNPADPNAASEFYAKALTTALGMVDTAVAKVNVERIQAYLMLGLHEWTRHVEGSGMAAWMYVGNAIRMAQSLVLGREEVAIDHNTSDQEELAMLKEMRRRTMFSCLIMDRLLSVGPRRVSAVRSSDLGRIRLPCSEVDFSNSVESQTAYLHDELKDSTGDSLLGRFVRLVDFWGEIIKYSFAGGRRRHGELPPWERASSFKQLRDRLDEFYASLPPTLTLSAKNFYRCGGHPNTGIFVSLHMLGAICQIMMHREYLPFLPVRCARPEGPLDPPYLPTAPPGFWLESAEHVFKAAKDIVILIQLSGDKLPHSAVVLFAVWTAAFVGLTAVHFPQMDANKHMHSEEEVVAMRDRSRDTTQVEGSATALTINALQKMKTFLPEAENYIQKFQEMNSYFSMAKMQYSAKNMEGGGLDEWKGRGVGVMSNGTIHPSDYSGKMTLESTDISRASTQDKGSPGGTDTFSSGVSVATPRSAAASSFTAINQVHPAGAAAVLDHAMHDEGRGVDQRGYHSMAQAPPLIPVYPFTASNGILAQQQYTALSDAALPKFDFDPAKAEVQCRGFILNELQDFAGAPTMDMSAISGIPMSPMMDYSQRRAIYSETDNAALAANAVNAAQMLAARQQ
jgi:hypothetical protein